MTNQKTDEARAKVVREFWRLMAALDERAAESSEAEAVDAYATHEDLIQDAAASAREVLAEDRRQKQDMVDGRDGR